MKAGLGLVLVAMALALAGCGVSGEDELRQWMAAQRSQTRPKVNPISEPKQFQPESYNQVTSMEPFSNQKLTQALKRESTQATANGALLAPELARRREALESFPLDAMTLVGSLTKESQPVALVKVENLLYQVRPGNYLGQNYGRVTKIAETEVTLREIVQDASGEWIERTATLQLQERSK
ncbi:MAG: pilus assembly protein PilP [Rhodocyclaceae bacterium]|nr:pilus assembly protein PilP [Rhodocyclaceae bacterium]